MICFIEVQCKKWEHVQVNAGFINLVHSVFPREKFMFFGDKEHLEAISALLDNNFLELCPVELPDQIVDSIKNVREYKNVLSNVMKQIQKFDSCKVILLSAHKGIILSIYEIARENKEISFYMVMHSIMEQLFYKNTRFHKLYRWVLRGERNLDWTLERLEKENNNINFIIYVPEYMEQLKERLSDNIIQRFRFVHHPYLFNDEAEYKEVVDSFNRIAIVGAALNRNAYNVVRKCQKLNVLFNVIQRTTVNLSKLCNINIVSKGKNILTEEVNECIQSSAWMLIPYNKYQYRITASGVFWDAVANRKPILALDSPYLCSYLKRYDIGIMRESIQQLCDVIQSECSVSKREMYEEKVHNIETFIKQISVENEKFIQKILGE